MSTTSFISKTVTIVCGTNGAGSDGYLPRLSEGSINDNQFYKETFTSITKTSGGNFSITIENINVPEEYIVGAELENITDPQTVSIGNASLYTANSSGDTSWFWVGTGLNWQDGDTVVVSLITEKNVATTPWNLEGPLFTYTSA